MVIALIHWKIKPDLVSEFLHYWQEEAVIQDRNGLIGEFLSEACDASKFPWITWDLTGCEGVYRSFINVGLWDNADDFHDQIAKYFVASGEPKSFEHKERTRTILRPTRWRIGDSNLPLHDSGGTL